MTFTAFLSLHLVGVALGLGGATIGDLAVLRSLRRRQPFPRDELKMLSHVIWLGLALLGVSGAAMFAMKPSDYIHSSGFAAKMIVVAGLVANGAYLHKRLPSLRLSVPTLAFAAISAVSWYAALAIAMFKSRLHITLGDYLLLYLVAIVGGWASYAVMYRRICSRATLSADHHEPTVAEELDRLRRDNETLRLAIRYHLGMDGQKQDVVLPLVRAESERRATNGKRANGLAS